ncbi:MAG: hypothetical protein KGP27_04030 [Hyphomicrobiales bacterium]|nr:hypothetical protein [Hyphomicrobiales bacterium]
MSAERFGFGRVRAVLIAAGPALSAAAGRSLLALLVFPAGVGVAASLSRSRRIADGSVTPAARMAVVGRKVGSAANAALTR